jgi:hypothetical protein
MHTGVGRTETGRDTVCVEFLPHGTVRLPWLRTVESAKKRTPLFLVLLLAARWPAAAKSRDHQLAPRHGSASSSCAPSPSWIAAVTALFGDAVALAQLPP